MPEKASANARSKVAILASETPVRVGRLPQMADVRVLGPVEVVDDAGQVLEIGGTRPRAVLALLAVRSPESVTVDEIIEQLWGDSDIADPEASLRVTVSRIRSATTEGLIATTSSGYRLEVPRSRLDLDRFRRYSARGRQYATLGHPAKAAESFRQALGQWRGAPLSDVTQFLFADKAASQLEEERLSAIEALVECEIGTGSHDLVIGDLSGLVERFPYRENLWRLLMVSLYRSGRQAEAIRAFARYRDLLGEELGLEPSAALSDLEERILLHDPALDDLPELASSEWLEEPELETFAVGDFVVREGEPADTVYWIESGRVEVGRESPEGDWHTLAELGPGRYFGELASLLGTTRTASVRVVVPTTVSIHNAASFRMRMGIQQSEEDEAPAAADLADLIRRGQYLQAYDGAARLIDRGNADPEVRHLATLALVRSGATSQARRRFDQYGLASIDPKSVSPRLAEDIAALAARLDKDMALASTGADREAWARRSAAAYQAASDPEAGAYPAVNAAFMWLVAGAVDRAETAARLALEAVEHADSKSGEDAYWDLAIEAEAALILGDLERARSALEGAASISIGNHSARAITTKQLRRICAIKDIGADILQPIRNPAVAHYCGHLILPPGREGRFVAADEARVSAELASAFDQLDVAVGYGSLAAGADILAAEALLDRGAELNVVLPFDRDEFIRTSVIPAGGRLGRPVRSAAWRPPSRWSSP